MILNEVGCLKNIDILIGITLPLEGQNNAKLTRFWFTEIFEFGSPTQRLALSPISIRDFPKELITEKLPTYTLPATEIFLLQHNSVYIGKATTNGKK